MSEENVAVHLYCCSAKKDERFRVDLDAHLLNLKKSNVDITYSSKIPGGTKREQTKDVDIFLFLISADFQNSEDHARETQLARKQYERDQACVRIVPILVRSCMVEGTPFDDLQMLPINKIPISQWPDRDEAFLHVATKIKEAVDDLRASSLFQEKKTKQRFERYFALGCDLYRSDGSDEQRAIAYFDLALQAYPQDARAAEAYYYKGVLLHRTKQYEESLEALEISLQLQPAYASAYNQRGEVLQALARYAEALLDYNKAITLEPNNAAFYTNNGKTLFQIAQHTEALAAYDRAIELDPCYVPAHQCRSRVLDRLFRYDEAAAANAEVIRLNPGYLQQDEDQADTHYRWGEYFFQNMHYNKALDQYEKAIRLNSHDRRFHCEKGRTLLALRRPDDALKAAQKAQHLDSKYAPAYHLQSDILHVLSKKLAEEAKEARARACLLEAREELKDNPDNIGIHHKIADALDILHCNFEAQKARNRAWRLERLQRAEEMLRRNAKDSLTHWEKGDALFQLKRYKEALQAFDEALDCDQENYQAYLGKEKVLIEFGHIREAEQMRTMARLIKAEVKLYTDRRNPLIHRQKGDLLTALNRFQEAQESYERALQLERFDAYSR